MSHPVVKQKMAYWVHKGVVREEKAQRAAAVASSASSGNARKSGGGTLHSSYVFD
jgi:hypothetical protein